MRGETVVRRVLPGGDIAEIIHRDSDPTMWIVRRLRKTFFGLRTVSTDWFNLEDDAEAFARAGAPADAAGHDAVTAEGRGWRPSPRPQKS
jgi:hypothetical protein